MVLFLFCLNKHKLFNESNCISQDVHGTSMTFFDNPGQHSHKVLPPSPVLLCWNPMALKTPVKTLTTADRSTVLLALSVILLSTIIIMLFASDHDASK